MRKIRERKHRLPPESYKGPVAAVFTACVASKGFLFVDTPTFTVFEQKLITASGKYSSVLPLYLFMPDHCHIILEGKDENADIYRAMVAFKQYTGFWLREQRFSMRWQKDFWDHLVRSDEDLHNQIMYILNNPVRAGLVKHWRDYPFKGSTMYNLNEW